MSFFFKGRTIFFLKNIKQIISRIEFDYHSGGYNIRGLFFGPKNPL